jgi:FkbM family methyltransferase
MLLSASSKSLRSRSSAPDNEQALKPSALGSAQKLLDALPISNGIKKALAARGNVESSALQPHKSPAPNQHAQIDVGFSTYEKNLTEQVLAALLEVSNATSWSNDMRAAFSRNVSESLDKSLKASLQPLKMTIGKTWMVLPQDAQKDEYINQLRSSFLPIFTDSLASATTHLSTSLKNIGALSIKKDLTPTDLLSKSETLVADSLLLDHCFALSSKKKPSNRTFCMKSIVGQLAHRLNDTLGLVTMTTRFDAGAMSFAQKANKTLPANCAGGGACADVWAGQAPYGKDGNHTCSWRRLNPGWFLHGGAPANMCLRSYPDAVSDYIRAQGVWHSCIDIAAAWPNVPDGSKAGLYGDQLSCGGTCQREHNTQPGIYVDIGANIGSCVMQMLSRPDVSQVVAFEPSPANLFYLTNSVREAAMGDANILRKLMLYPKALGSERSVHKLFEQPGNAGNTGVDTTVMGSEMNGVTIETITLDEVFMSGSFPPYIHLMKVDAQGYEVKILKGAQRLLASGAVNALHLEVAPWWLAGQKTSVLEYLSQLHEKMYDMRPLSSPHFLSTDQLAKLACDLDRNGTIVDVFALRNRVAPQHPPRAPLRCL